MLSSVRDWRSLAAMLTDGVRAAGLAGCFSADSLLLRTRSAAIKKLTE